VRRLVAPLVLALAAAAPAQAAPAKGPAPVKRTAAVKRAASAPAKRREIVCFKKTLRVGGRAVRRKVCRPRRKAAAKRPAPAIPLAPPAAQPLAPPAATPATPAPPAATAPAVERAPLCLDSSPWVGATAEDVAGVFRLTLSRACVRAGRVLVQLRNRDLQPHNVWAVAAGRAPREVVADLDPETTGQGAADLDAGDWTLYCAIPGHGSMTRALTVTPAS
jgi:hypothetical protein